MRSLKKAVPVALVGLAVAAGPAYAQSSIQGYSGNAGLVTEVDRSNNPDRVAGQRASAGAAASDSDGQGDVSAALPFTGADLGLIAGAGGLLLGLGLVMRRVIRRPNGA